LSEVVFENEAKGLFKELLDITMLFRLAALHQIFKVSQVVKIAFDRLLSGLWFALWFALNFIIEAIEIVKHGTDRVLLFGREIYSSS